MRRRSRVVGLIAIVTLVLASAVARGPASQLSSAPSPDEMVVVAVDRLLADRWYPATPESTIQNSRDETILAAALHSANENLRAFAVRQLGRFEDVGRAGSIAAFLDDRSAAVRVEAIRSLVRALRYTKGPEIDAARQRIASLISTDPVRPNATNLTVIYEALGRLHQTGGAANEIERQLIEEIDASPPLQFAARLGQTSPRAAPALAGLEWLVLQDPARPILDRTRTTLLKLAYAGFGNRPDAPSAVALRILATLHVVDLKVAENAIRYRCPPPVLPKDMLTCGWEIRQSGVQLLDPRDSKFDKAFESAFADAAVPVRLEALRKRTGVISETKQCDFLLDALSSPFLIERQEAVDRATPICNERDAVTERLKAMAVDYGDAQRPLERVPIAAHALIALARFSPDDARADIEKIGAGDADWNGLIQVRQAGATAAGVLKDEAIALRFMSDPDPNVQTEALKSLNLIRSELRFTEALLAIESTDYQLIRTAAAVLRSPPDRQQASAALLKALARLTAEGKDTSREVRLEIFDRLKEMITADPGATNPLYVAAKTVESYLRDFDPLIASAAADVLGVMDNGKRPMPHPTRRPIEVDSTLPNALRSVLGTLAFGNPGDELQMIVFPREAPLSLARFRNIPTESQRIYRIVPLSFFAVGPQGNEFSADARFLRDEIGSEPHEFGSIGMLTHGRDTGNGQFFIDLLRHPEWDDDFTVVGRVTGCTKGYIDVTLVNCLSELLEGTKITKIDVK